MNASRLSIWVVASLLLESGVTTAFLVPRTASSSSSVAAAAGLTRSRQRQPWTYRHRGANVPLAAETTSSSNTENQLESEQLKKEEAFVNDGPMAWMTTYLDLFGLQEGKSVYYGPIPVDVDESKRVSSEKAAELQYKAAKELTNINMDERERRGKAGSVMAALSIAYITWASLIADDGGFAGHVLRFLSAIPLFLAVGYKVSASTGLCNIAQAGLWDIDGNGLSKIGDPDLAKTFLNRVNNMNTDNLVKVVVPVTLFALLPQSTSAPLAFFLALFAILYASRDKIPQNL